MTAEVTRTHRFTASIGRIGRALKSVNIGQGEKVGYTEDSSEERLQAVAKHEGVKLYRNSDGSYIAVDESKSDFGPDIHV